MSEYMTIAEIKAKYPNEWVFLANPTATRYNEVTGGHVVLHNADRAEYSRLVGQWRIPGRAAFRIVVYGGT